MNKVIEKVKGAVDNVGDFIYEHRGVIGTAVGTIVGAAVTIYVHNKYAESNDRIIEENPLLNYLSITLEKGLNNSNYVHMVNEETYPEGVDKYTLRDYGNVGDMIGSMYAYSKNIDYADDDIKNAILDSTVPSSAIFSNIHPDIKYKFTANRRYDDMDEFIEEIIYGDEM